MPSLPFFFAVCISIHHSSSSDPRLSSTSSLARSWSSWVLAKTSLGDCPGPAHLVARTPRRGSHSHSLYLSLLRYPAVVRLFIAQDKLQSGGRRTSLLPRATLDWRDGRGKHHPTSPHLTSLNSLYFTQLPPNFLVSPRLDILAFAGIQTQQYPHCLRSTDRRKPIIVNRTVQRTFLSWTPFLLVSE